jgi:hypothetical protein
VGGTSQLNDLQTMSSNYGDCVDLYAPSENIYAPLIGKSISQFSSLSGSSASAAIITGIAGLVLSLLQTPLRQLPLDLTRSSSYQSLVTVVRDHHSDFNLDTMTLSSLLFTILYPPDSLNFLRNILTSIYSSLSQNRTKLVHSPSFSRCDYENLDTLLSLLIDSVTHLYRQQIRPKAFFNLKNNLAIHLKQQIEDFYQHEDESRGMGWEDEENDNDNHLSSIS